MKNKFKKIEHSYQKGVIYDRGWDGCMVSLTHEVEQTPGDSEGQGSLICCSPWGHKELDMT